VFTNRRVVPVEAVARPKGLGLGADRSLTLQQKDDGKSTSSSHDDQLVMKKGSYCVVQAGTHEGLYATVGSQPAIIDNLSFFV
jgi:hypothetical protein